MSALPYVLCHLSLLLNALPSLRELLIGVSAMADFLQILIQSTMCSTLEIMLDGRSVVAECI